MPEYIGIFFSLFAGIVPLAIIGTIIYVIVLATRRNGEKNGLKMTPSLLLQMYIYFLLFVTLALTVIGGAIAIKASLAFMEPSFGYTLNKASATGYPQYDNYYLSEKGNSPCYKGDPITFGDGTYCFDSTQRKTDLINGLTLLLSMTILFSLHKYALGKISPEKAIQWIKKLYTFLSLILYSLVSIVALPTAIYLLTNYLLFETAINTYSTPIAPGAAISVVIFSVPLWMYFLRETINLKEDEQFTESKDKSII